MLLVLKTWQHSWCFYNLWNKGLIKGMSETWLVSDTKQKKTSSPWWSKRWWVSVFTLMTTTTCPNQWKCLDISRKLKHRSKNPNQTNRKTKTIAKPHRMKAYLLKMAAVWTTKRCTYDTQHYWGALQTAHI